MNVTLVKALLATNHDLVDLIKYLKTDLDVTTLAELVKNDPCRVKEFIKTILYRSRIPINGRYDALIILDRVDAVYDLISIDNEGKLDYEDERLVGYAIQKAWQFYGVPYVHERIIAALSNKESKFDVVYASFYAMDKFVLNFREFIYSEFNFDPIITIKAIKYFEDVDNQKEEGNE